MRGFCMAKQMWEHLEKVYQQSNLVRKFQIEYEISKYGQWERNIQEYYVGFMDLWTEYEIVSIGDVKTTCCLKSLKVTYEERKVMQFLMKLWPDYEVAQANILNRFTSPTMDQVLGELLREETIIVTQVSLENKGGELVFFVKWAIDKSSTKDQSMM